MSPRTSEQYHHIRMKKKRLIMETALELFAENGFHATSISQIAKKAGISKGLIYNYFKSKQEILDELITHGFDVIFETINMNNDGVLSEEEFVNFLRKVYKLLRENLQHWKLFFSLLIQPSVVGTFASEYAEKGAPMFKMMLDFIKSKGSTDPEGDLMVISSMIEGSFLYCMTIPDFFPMDILEEKIINAIPRIISSK